MCWRRDFSVYFLMSVPSMSISPPETSYILGIMEQMVVLPPPLSPTSATFCPRGILRFMPLRTFFPGT